MTNVRPVLQTALANETPANGEMRPRGGPASELDSWAGRATRNRGSRDIVARASPEPGRGSGRHGTASASPRHARRRAVRR